MLCPESPCGFRCHGLMVLGACKDSLQQSGCRRAFFPGSGCHLPWYHLREQLASTGRVGKKGRAGRKECDSDRGLDLMHRLLNQLLVASQKQVGCRL